MHNCLCNFPPTLCPPEFIFLSLFSFRPFSCSPYLFSTSLSPPPSCHLKQNQRACGKHQNTNHQHFLDHLLSCSVFVCIPSTPPCLHRFPSTSAWSLPAKLSFPPAFFSPHRCHGSPHHSLHPSPSSSIFFFLLLLLHSSCFPACLPSFHLSSLELTVPEGRGHLRTKWRISRQLCAHSLRWPSIIHSLRPPLPFSLSPSSLCPFHLSLPSLPLRCFFFFHTPVACLPLSIPSFKLLSLPSLKHPFDSLAHHPDHHSTIFSPHPHLHFTNPLLLSFCLLASLSFPCVSL